MSGLFRRLAEHASGQRGTTLHAMARLPYQGASSWRPAANPLPGFPGPELASPPLAASEAYAERHTPASAPPSNPRRARQSAPTVSATSAAPADPVPDTAAQRPTSLSVTPFENPAPLPPPRLPQPRLAARQETAQTPGAASVSPARPAAVQPRPPRLPASPAATAATQAAAPSPASPFAANPGDAERPQHVPRAEAPSLPAALLPRPTLQHNPPQPATLSSPPQSARQPDEVHIHIGRIEVTAIQQAAPAKRRERKGQAPLSLDDYLAQRKGEER